jgi:hypothetical protein
MLRREPDAEAFRSCLARELGDVSPRPGGWERVRSSLVVAAGETRPRRAAWLLPALPLAALALCAGLVAVAATGGLATRTATDQPVEAPIVSVCGVLVAIATPISLAEARRRASFPILTEPGSTPSRVDWLTFATSDPGCGPRARLVYRVGGSTAVVQESATSDAVPAAPTGQGRVETASSGGRRLLVGYADASRTRVAAVTWRDDRTRGSALFDVPVSRHDALDFVARLA